MIYLGSINLFYCFYGGFWGLLAKLRLCRPIQRRIEPKLIMEEMARMQQAEAQKAKLNGKAMKK